MKKKKKNTFLTADQYLTYCTQIGQNSKKFWLQ